MTKGQFKANICSVSLGKRWNKRLWHLIKSCYWFCCHWCFSTVAEKIPHTRTAASCSSKWQERPRQLPLEVPALPGSSWDISSHAEAGLHHIKLPKMQLWSPKPSCWHLSPSVTSMGRVNPKQLRKSNCNSYFFFVAQNIFLSDFCILIWQAADVKNISIHTMLPIPCLCLLPCMLESEVPLPSSEQSMMLYDTFF